VVLAALGVVAFVTDGILGFALGFIAALLLVDRAWPMTGVLFDDAQHAYARLARERRFAAVGRLSGHETGLRGRRRPGSI
jgi:hypothetical protein